MPFDQLQNVLKPLEPLLPFCLAEIQSQLEIWQCIWADEKVNGEPIPETVVGSLAECNKDLIPAIFRILQIFSLPITTATSERSFSTLKSV